MTQVEDMPLCTRDYRDHAATQHGMRWVAASTPVTSTRDQRCSYRFSRGGDSLVHRTLKVRIYLSYSARPR
jgi:hypothetical protein